MASLHSSTLSVVLVSMFTCKFCLQAPQPPEPWEGVRDALEEGSPSPHIQSHVDEGFKGDEDCLFLNVYTPKVSSSGGLFTLY